MPRQSHALAAATLWSAALACVLPDDAGAFQVMRRNELPAHWSGSDVPVHFRVGQGGTEDVSDGSDVPAAVDSFRTWQDVACATVAVTYDGEFANPAKDIQDSVNWVYWVESGWPPELGPLSLAATTPALDRNAIIRDADMRFNGENFCWSTTRDPNCADVAHVATHEAGHFFGLDHETVALEATMYPQSDPGVTGNETLHQDDIDGICYLYPSFDGSPGSPCDAKPCGGGAICASHAGRQVCSSPCGTTADCQSAFECGNGACVPIAGVGNGEPGSATPPAAGQRGSICASSAPCGANLICVTDESGARCHVLCDTDADCSAGELCYTLEDGGGIDLGSAACFCETEECYADFEAGPPAAGDDDTTDDDDDTTGGDDVTGTGATPLDDDDSSGSGGDVGGGGGGGATTGGGGGTATAGPGNSAGGTMGGMGTLATAPDDGATGDDSSDGDDGGCGCRAGRNDSTPGFAFFAALGGLAVAYFRTRGRWRAPKRGS